MKEYKRTNVYETADEKTMKAIFDYAEGYKKFLGECKTEREACAYIVEEAEKKGYKQFDFSEKVKKGDKLYYNNRGKAVFIIKIGTGDVKKDGIRIVGSHIDNPRLDLKQVPLYEDNGVAFAKTHYYGGIRKYQWATIPLALHGVVAKKNGEVVTVKIGEEDSDPVFYVSDLLPHLAAKQNAKTLGEAIEGENLNIWLGNIPYGEKEDDKTVKKNLLKILEEKYGIEEEDFLSAELSLTPSFKPTLLKLLMRFWDVNKGNIKISEENVKEIPTKTLRNTQSYVTQETELFHDSIANNIAIGKPGAAREEIIKAAQKASIHDMIMSLPNGYDTEVGELGDTLSGGEKQRIGIARAFLHDSPMLLLDEPTSNLDSLNEGIILKSLKEESQGRTVVLVSHRESTMGIADEVYHMDAGRVS